MPEAPSINGGGRSAGLAGGDGTQFVELNLAVFEFNYAISQMIKVIVVGNNDNGLSSGLQLGENLEIKDFLEHRILICRPFVEDINGAVLQVSRQKGQPFPLPLGKIEGREL